MVWDETKTNKYAITPAADNITAEDWNDMVADQKDRLSKTLDTLDDITDGAEIVALVNASAETIDSDNIASILTGKTLNSSTNDIHADSVHAFGINTTGSTITEGSAVYVSGYNIGSDIFEITLADNSSASTMPCFGIVHADIANGATGMIVLTGVIESLDTSAHSVGDELYVGTSGTLVSTKPTGTAGIQKVAIVLRSNANTGAIVVFGAGRVNDVPNIAEGKVWIGNASGVATATTLATVATTGAYSDLSGTPTIPTQLSDLSDVGVTTATNRNVMVADGDSWESRALVEADISDLGTYAVDSAVVHDTGDETVAGIKTFSSFPVTPSSAPTADYQTANKKYVDDEILSAGGYNDEAAQDAVGGILVDSTEIDFTYNDATPSITAAIVSGSIDETKLDTSVNASLDLADSALQVADVATVATTGAYSDLTGTPSIPSALSELTGDSDDISEGSVNLYMDTVEQAKLANISVTQAVDLDTMESNIATNNAKVTNATHTGDVTGSTTLTIDSTAISGKTAVTAVGTDYVLIGDTSDAGALKKALISDFASAGGDMAASTYDPTNVADDAFDMANMVENTDAKVMTAAERTAIASIPSTLDDLSDGTTYVRSENNYTDADAAIVASVESGADVTDATNVAAAGALMTTGGTMSGDIAAGNNDVLSIKTATFNAEYDNSTSGTSKTIDWNNGQKQKITLSDNCTFTFTDFTAGVGNLVLKIVQDATGSRTATFPIGVYWEGGTAPTLSTGANAVDIVSFYFDGTYYYGVAGLNFS